MVIARSVTHCLVATVHISPFSLNNLAGQVFAVIDLPKGDYMRSLIATFLALGVILGQVAVVQGATTKQHHVTQPTKPPKRCANDTDHDGAEKPPKCENTDHDGA